jgi:hypothetical protein
MGHLLKIKWVNVLSLSSISVPLRLTPVQVPNLALTQTETDNSEGSPADKRDLPPTKEISRRQKGSLAIKRDLPPKKGISG